MRYLTEDLITAAKHSEFFPTGQTTFTDQSPDDMLLRYANEELQTKLLPLLISARADYFAAVSQVTLKNNLNHYAFPERAAGNVLKDIFYCPDSSQVTTRWTIPRFDVHDLGSRSSITGMPSGFYIQGDEVILTPTPSGMSGVQVLLMHYFMRPNELVMTSDCAKITGSATSGDNTVFSVDTDLTGSLSVGDKLDFISGTSPFRPWSIDVPVVAIDATSITVLSAQVTDESGALEPVKGDYISPAQTANVPMIPQEFHPILSEMIAYRALKALGTTTHLQACAQNIKDMIQGAMKLINNRIEGEPEVVYDSSGFLTMTPFFGYRTLTR